MKNQYQIPDFVLDQIRGNVPRIGVVAVLAIISLFLVSLDCGAATDESSALGGVDAAVVCCKLIGWGGFILVLAMLRGFIVAGLTLAFRDVLQNASPQTIATLARQLLVKGVISDELAQRVEQLEAAAGKKRS